MAQFLGKIEGNRQAVTRLGTKDSGMLAIATGWDLGVEVVGRHVDGEDEFTILVNGGSNGRYPALEVMKVKRIQDSLVITPGLGWDMLFGTKKEPGQ